MLIVRRSPFTGTIHELDLPVTQEELNEFFSGQGRLIQNIWPNLTPGQREFIKTGITDEEWDAAFGDETEEPGEAYQQVVDENVGDHGVNEYDDDAPEVYE